MKEEPPRPWVDHGGALVQTAGGDPGLFEDPLDGAKHPTGRDEDGMLATCARVIAARSRGRSRPSRPTSVPSNSKFARQSRDLARKAVGKAQDQPRPLDQVLRDIGYLLRLELIAKGMPPF